MSHLCECRRCGWVEGDHLERPSADVYFAYREIFGDPRNNPCPKKETIAAFCGSRETMCAVNRLTHGLHWFYQGPHTYQQYLGVGLEVPQ